MSIFSHKYGVRLPILTRRGWEAPGRAAEPPFKRAGSGENQEPEIAVLYERRINNAERFTSEVRAKPYGTKAGLSTKPCIFIILPCS
jgi:hypothetical protein